VFEDGVPKEVGIPDDDADDLMQSYKKIPAFQGKNPRFIRSVLCLLNMLASRLAAENNKKKSQASKEQLKRDLEQQQLEAEAGNSSTSSSDPAPAPDPRASKIGRGTGPLLVFC